MTDQLADFALAMRQHQTTAELRLWYWLRKRPLGFKFRRQVILGQYLVDFACYAAKLAIEVDGQFHAYQESDVVRDEAIAAMGWEVARYWNTDVKHGLEGVLLDLEGRRGRRAGGLRGHEDPPLPP